jgi:hypothetical protein
MGTATILTCGPPNNHSFSLQTKQPLADGSRCDPDFATQLLHRGGLQPLNDGEKFVIGMLFVHWMKCFRAHSV